MPANPHNIEKKRILHLAEGKFSFRFSKMTTGVLRYGFHDSVAVIDSTKAGKTSQEILGIGGDVPVISSIEEGMKFNPQVLLVGITPAGGQLTDEVKKFCLDAIERGLDVWAGLHDFLVDDPDIASAAERNGVRLWDIRRPGKKLPVGAGLCRWSKSYISTMVGSDAAIGKMTVALEIDREARKRGIKSEFVATGQCGIAIAGWGSPIDAIAGDFMAGCVERDCLSVDGAADFILVEGQGSLLHPGFSAVTLGLIHGSCPHSLILCHQTTRTEISNMKDIPIPSLSVIAEMYLSVARPFRPDVKIIGVSLNTSGTTDEEARAAVEAAAKELGVPATDPVRYGAAPLVEAIEKHRREIGM